MGLELGFGQNLVEFADQSAAAQTMATLRSLTDRAVKAMGFRYFALFRRTDLKADPAGLYCGTVPEPYAGQVVDERLYMECAPNQASRDSLAGVCWQTLRRELMLNRKQKEIENRAESFGMVGGFTYAIRVPREPDGIFSAARPDAIDTSEAEKVALRSIATTALENAIRISHIERATACPMLGRRQLECTELVAQGKTDWEIAQILGVSRDTVHEYVEGARKRYGVRTRTQLVVEAIRTGQLGLDALPR